MGKKRILIRHVKDFDQYFIQFGSQTFDTEYLLMKHLTFHVQENTLNYFTK